MNNTVNAEQNSRLSQNVVSKDNSLNAESWRYVETELAAVVVIGEGDDEYQIKPHWRGLGDSAEIQCIMKLIAAAPNLYDACKAILASLDGSPTNFNGMLAAHRKLEAAISLANREGIGGG